MFHNNNKKCLYYAVGKSFDMIEKKETVKAKITVTKTAFPCIYIPNMDEKGKFLLLDQGETGKERVRRCADHVVFVFDKGTACWSVHIFELTRTLSEDRWMNKVLIQFTGALVRAYAVAGVLQIRDFHNIYLHCGYREISRNASFVSHRRPTGKPAPPDWSTGPITLYAPFHQERFRKKVHNRPIQLDLRTGEATLSSLEI